MSESSSLYGQSVMQHVVESRYASLLDKFVESGYKAKTLDQIQNLIRKLDDVDTANLYLKDAVLSHLFLMQEAMRPRTDKSTGHVYVIEYGSGLLKIGCTIKPEKRMAAHRATASSKIMRSYVSPCVSGHRLLERRLHVKFKKFRTHGEFFNAGYQEVIDEMERQLELGLEEGGAS